MDSGPSRDLEVVVWCLSILRRLDVTSGVFLRALEVKCWLTKRIVRLPRQGGSQINILYKIVVVESGILSAAWYKGYRVVVLAGFDNACKRVRQIG